VLTINSFTRAAASFNPGELFIPNPTGDAHSPVAIRSFWYGVGGKGLGGRG